jgi:hypothetical protein
MQNLARRLIAAEHRPRDSADNSARAAFRVCDKLRESLSALVGTRGFRTLMVRALSLAKIEVPWLSKVEVGTNGLPILPDALERETDPDEAAKGGLALVTQLLDLLATLIGDALTLRLVQQIWPKTALNDPKSGGKT